MYRIKPNWRLLRCKRVALPELKPALAECGQSIMARKKSPERPGSGKVRKAPVRRVPMREFSRSLPMSLLRAREAVMRHFRASLRDHGLTEQQWRILRALASVDTIEVTELARVAFLLGPSLSRILRDLEARHLIERRAAKTDLRRGVVSISAKGLRLIEAVAPSSEAIYAAITRRYGAGKLRELQDMLHALEGSLSELRINGEANEEAGESE
jgi:homoprotocatechuate degradation regulator HpaR